MGQLVSMLTSEVIGGTQYRDVIVSKLPFIHILSTIFKKVFNWNDHIQPV